MTCRLCSGPTPLDAVVCAVCLPAYAQWRRGKLTARKQTEARRARLRVERGVLWANRKQVQK